MTFNDPSTGPISVESLKGQVLRQRRWQEQLSLASFKRVIVHGSKTYLEVCRRAFEGTGASLVAASASENTPGSQAPVQLPAEGLLILEERATAIGEALSDCRTPSSKSWTGAKLSGLFLNG